MEAMRAAFDALEDVLEASGEVLGLLNGVTISWPREAPPENETELRNAIDAQIASIHTLQERMVAAVKVLRDGAEPAAPAPEPN